MVLFEIYQRFKGHFMNKLRVSFNVKRSRPVQICVYFKKTGLTLLKPFFSFYISNQTNTNVSIFSVKNWENSSVT